MAINNPISEPRKTPAKNEPIVNNVPMRKKWGVFRNDIEAKIHHLYVLLQDYFCCALSSSRFGAVLNHF